MIQFCAIVHVHYGAPTRVFCPNTRPPINEGGTRRPRPKHFYQELDAAHIFGPRGDRGVRESTL